MRRTSTAFPPPGSPRWFNGFCTTSYFSPAAPSAGNSSRRSGWSTVEHRRMRRGALFNYVMVYMTISAALMTTAGLCLHAILKSDSSDRRESLFLNSLQRAEHQLRADSRQNGVTFESPTSIMATTNGETRVQWAADRGLLTRREQRQDDTAASDRFIFPAGSQILMEPGPENSVVIRITEPSVFVTYSQVANGGSNRNKPVDEAIPGTPSYVAQPKFAEIRLRGAKR